MTDMWPYLGMKTGGIKRGELVVIGAFSKDIRTTINDKAVCMYQVQYRIHLGTWRNYGRPWLMRSSAEQEAENIAATPLYESRIVEV